MPRFLAHFEHAYCRLGDVASLVGATDRHARRIVAALTAAGVVSASGARAPLRLAFPAALAPRWMPGLFPEATR